MDGSGSDEFGTCEGRRIGETLNRSLSAWRLNEVEHQGARNRVAVMAIYQRINCKDFGNVRDVISES